MRSSLSAPFGLLLACSALALVACSSSTPPAADPAASAAPSAAPGDAASATAGPADDPEAKKRAESDQARKAIDESQSGKKPDATAGAAGGKLSASIKIDPPPPLKAGDLSGVQIKFHVTNASSEAVDPAIDRSELLFDGKPLSTWKDTTAKIPRKGGFLSLPPGESIDFAYGFGGRKVKMKPGSYSIVLKTPAVTSDPVTLVVEP